MTLREEAEQLAEDRPTSLSDDLYQWAMDAEEMLWKLSAQAAQPAHAHAIDTSPERVEKREGNVQVPVAYWIPKAEQFCVADKSGRPFAKAWEPLYAAPSPKEQSND